MSRLPESILNGRTRLADIESLLRPDSDSGDLAPGERRVLCWVLPPWQRPEVWEEGRKRAFIEGIFLGLGTGTYVVHQPDWDESGRKPMSGWLIDGQQRISAIRDFVQGDLTIFDGLRYADLDEVERRRRFLHLVFPYVELPYQEDEKFLRELYLRLNFGGVPHTQADLDRVRNTAQPEVDQLSEQFLQELADVIGYDSFREVVTRNAALNDPSICASHDFCDANMVMAAAFEKVMKREVDTQSDADLAVWNEAWDRAKRLMPSFAESHGWSADTDRPREQ